MGLHGGRNRLDIFRVKVNSGGTAYEILDKLTSSAAETPAVANVAYTTTYLEGNGLTYTEGGEPGLSFNQLENDDWEGFLQAVNPPTKIASSADLPEVTFENGTKLSETSNNPDTLVLVVDYGSLNSAKNKVKLGVFLMNVVLTSGSVTRSGTDYNKPTLELQSARPQFAITIPAGMYRNDVVNTTAANTAIPTLAINANRAIKFVDLPS